MNVFLVYTTATGLVHSFHPTQAAADTVANADTTLTAKSGAIAVTRDMQPGQTWFNASAGTLALENIVLTVKDVARAAHLQRVGAHHIGKQIAVGFPPEIGMKFDSFIFWTAPFGYIVAHSDAYTVQQKIAWFREMPKGPLDIRVTGNDFAGAILRFFLRAQNDSGIEAPTSPSAWVNPETGMAVNLDSLQVLGDEYPNNIDFATGSWIEALTI